MSLLGFKRRDTPGCGAVRSRPPGGWSPGVYSAGGGSTRVGDLKVTSRLKVTSPRGSPLATKKTVSVSSPGRRR